MNSPKENKIKINKHGGYNDKIEKNCLIKAFTCLTLLALLIPSVTLQNYTYAEDASSISQEDLNQKFRKEFGFPDQPQSFIQLTNESSIEKYGVLLTESEEAEMDRRIQVEKDFLPEFEKSLQNSELGGSYAGIYIQQDPEHKIIVTYKEQNTIKSNPEDVFQTNENVEDDLLAQVNVSTLKSGDLIQPEEIEFKAVQYSEEELQSYASLVIEKIPSFEEEGIKITKVFSDFVNQKIVVSIPEATEQQKNYIQSFFSNFPLKFDEDLGGATLTARNTYTGFIMGGHEINEASPTGSACSAGAVAKSPSTGVLYLITAGHCASQGTNYYQGGKLLGPMALTYMGYYADTGAIRINTSNFNPSNTVYETSGPNPGTSERLNMVQALSSSYSGEVVSKSGRTTGTTTGTLLAKDVYYTALQRSYFQSSTVCEEGDSGGTVFYGNALKGIVGARDGFPTNYMLYTHAERAMNGLRLTLYTP
ncbi:S1 family peptidase [Saccharibacillus qingshengii]|uniref:S1 family peptidase n=1 Tax=Saccharibacillus qingshengii TaxID=1763540 RepID=UPI001551D089|nr:S1 family peptidase [Saccharibacillus qingshengii]